MMNPDTKKLLDLIGSKEAPKGYDQIYTKAEGLVGKPKLTIMSLDQVRALQEKMAPSGSTACGRYQFIRATFDATRKAMGLPGYTVWIPQVQDGMAEYLLVKRGLNKFITGEISREAFANNLAMEWASLPVVTPIRGQSRHLIPGQSFYAGDGLNKALHSPKDVLEILDAIKLVPSVSVSPSPVNPLIQRLAFTVVAIAIIIGLVIAVYLMWN